MEGSSQKDALDQFGKMLIGEVYDTACDEMRRAISRPLRGIKPNDTYEQFARLDPDSRPFVRQLVVDAISQTLAQFLHFIDVHAIPLPIKSESGEGVDVRKLSDGLAAEPYNEWGWIAQYSKFKNGTAAIHQDGDGMTGIQPDSGCLRDHGSRAMVEPSRRSACREYSWAESKHRAGIKLTRRRVSGCLAFNLTTAGDRLTACPPKRPPRHVQARASFRCGCRGRYGSQSRPLSAVRRSLAASPLRRESSFGPYSHLTPGTQRDLRTSRSPSTSHLPGT